ncbi:potassium/proton antiporter [Paenibacillus physcomitrellae]|uniref:K(+)/H(+) antiporter NhaP2 n=1 Tax=Paenibacillus physcomitrellae TaxID=1619311 RepID=A0ABQ1FV97_9BACL|nr:potassium/proton antiporter [Paenibacillus physcomitrellae]GGA31772.1 K(+)/H(+) antiporter NhaP2 [Paenibacillus physcomitrellae]
MELTVLTEQIVILLAILLLVGVLATKFSSKFGLPALVFFIAAGMVLSRFVYFDNPFLTQLVGTLALVVILLDGGMQTKFFTIRPVIGSALSLATIGVVVTTVLIGLAAHYILNVSLSEGLLFGAIVGSTDAAAVFSVLSGRNIKERITSTLEAESGSNDPMAVFLTVTLISWIQHPDQEIWRMLLSFAMEMGIGLAAGLAIGWLAVKSINLINFDSSGLYPVMAIAFAVLTYGLTSAAHGSGLLAVYVMALVLGNSDLTYRQSILQFNKGFAWIMQITMFTLLGLLVFPEDLLGIIWPGLALSLLLMLVARPAGVLAALLFSKFKFKEQLLLSWAGLRGAVPIVLATYPLLAGLEHGQLFFNVVFFVILTSAAIQGPTISPLARRLKLSEESRSSGHSLLELVSLGKTRSEINHIHIHAGMRAVGRRISQLELPENVLVTAIIRGEQIVTPLGDTMIKEGDTLYILGPKAERASIKSVFSFQDTALSSVSPEPELIPEPAPKAVKANVELTQAGIETPGSPENTERAGNLESTGDLESAGNPNHAEVRKVRGDGEFRK